ncbi:MAG: carbamoyltransferase HypF [Deltaproteobacteria bacterium]|nr:carbamoyltransferase HypF [Deltaproteobacteria bacterium]
MSGVGSSARRLLVQVDGIVQGVGFRPSVYRLALQNGLSGFVRNGPGGLHVEIQGDPEVVSRFVDQVRSNVPRSARPGRFQVTRIPLCNDSGFEIVPSDRGGKPTASIPLETAVCPECLSEMADPDDRRHGYAFTNCTCCGPRYTIVRDLPYDRAATSMDGFTMCAACAAEYGDPASRRFHAQASCCPQCGPHLRLVGGRGDPLTGAAEALASGRIAAIKGLGGFHLACSAYDEEAVARLRRRKRRELKPLAVMAVDLAAASRLACVGEAEASLLGRPSSPIVLADKLDPDPLAAGVAPGAARHGIMLAYTPLHHLLLDALPSADAMPAALVMTSANREGDPIMIDDGADMEGLRELAEVVLTHDRPILHRADDSLMRPVGASRAVVLRCSRGLAPGDFTLPVDSPPLLAVGSDLKCTVAVARGRRAVLGAHVGRLESPASYAFFRESIDLLVRLASIEPEVAACDLHPDMLGSVFAREESGLDVIRVQHHEAHLASCLVDASRWEPCIGVVFDGAGMGVDGTVWGGEFFCGDPARPERAAHLDTVPLPGGDLAARQPWRMALSYLHHACGGSAGLVDSWPRGEVDGVLGLLSGGRSGPATSSMGRLFDGVAALVCGCRENGYEAQSAMKLESIVDPSEAGTYAVDLIDGRPLRVDLAPLFLEIADDVRRGAAPGVVAARFHAWVRDMVIAVCLRLRDASGIGVAALSGGTFANAVLLDSTSRALEERGFTVLTHRSVPPGDGGIALGQAAVAAVRRSG